MTIRLAITLAAASMALIMGPASAQVAANTGMSGQSARAGTAAQAAMRAETRFHGTGMWRDRYAAPARDWNMPDDYDRDRSDRPDRQR